MKIKKVTLGSVLDGVIKSLRGMNPDLSGKWIYVSACQKSESEFCEIKMHLIEGDKFGKLIFFMPLQGKTD